MVASESEDFAKEVSRALEHEGAVVVSIDTVDGALEAMTRLGVRPDVLVVDCALPSGPELVAVLRRLQSLRGLRVFIAAPVRAPEAFPPGHVTIVKRHHLSSVFDAVEGVQGLLL